MRLIVLLCAVLSAGPALVATASGEEIERSMEHERLTLFQMVARSEIIVHARVTDGAGRFAAVEVLTTLKGDVPGPLLRVDFRDLNLQPHGQDLVVFRDGEEYVLFLARRAGRRPREKNANILGLVHGRRGRMLVAPEGGEQIVGALGSLVPLARTGPEEQLDGLRSLLSAHDPFLIEAVLEELGRLRSASHPDLPVLLRLLGDASPGIRSRVLPLIALLFASVRAEDHARIADDREALGLVLERARNDPDAGVRAESVRTLGSWPTPADVVHDLRDIAQQDRSQTVRYEAERVLFRLRS